MRPVLQVAVTDPILGEKLAFEADLLTLAAAASEGAAAWLRRGLAGPSARRAEAVELVLPSTALRR